MEKVRSILWYWGPGAIWMGFIFYLSSHQRVKATDSYLIDFAIFKTLHMIEYGLLYFFIFRAFYSRLSDQISLRQKMKWAFFISLIYAFTDEIHQRFVPTRNGQLKDVLIDLIGISLMFSYIKNNLKGLKRIIS